jgi:predicted  nucleic acid-binding Zn-ribbon protein
MSAALGLFRLQQIDRQIDQAQERLDAIQKILDNDTELRDALGRVQSAEQSCADAGRTLREAEAQAAAQQIKIEQAESSLYGGHVHNPKELQDLQNDVASLKRHLSSLEERQLEAMVEVDTVQSALDSARASLDGVQSQRSGDQSRLLDEQAGLRKNLERLRAERQATDADLPAAALELYSTLRGRKRGLAVAQINDSTCSACGTTLNAAFQQGARSATQLAYCPSCGRILYAS